MPLFLISVILTIFVGGCQSEKIKAKPPVPYAVAAWGRCSEGIAPSKQSSIEFYLWNQSTVAIEVSLESLAPYKPARAVTYNLKRAQGDQSFADFKAANAGDPKLAPGDAMDVEFQTASSPLASNRDIQIDLKVAQTSYQLAIPCRY